MRTTTTAKFTSLGMTLLFPLFLLLSGCWDRVEINDIAIILATGIDVNEKGQYVLSVQIVLPGQMKSGSSSGSADSGKSFYVDSAVGETIRQAHMNLQSRKSRELFLAHRRVLVVSEEVARTRGLVDVFDTSVRLSDNRLTTTMIISRSPAIKILEATPRLELSSMEAIRELAVQDRMIDEDMLGVAQDIGRRDIEAIMLYMDVAPIQSSEEDGTEVDFLGYAQLKSDKMVGVFDRELDYSLGWLRGGRQPQVVFWGKDRHESVAVVIDKSRTTIHPHLQNDKLTFVVKGNYEGRISEDLSDADLRDVKALKQLEEELRAQIEHSMRTIIAQVKEQGSDSLGLGTRFYAKYPRKWEDYYRDNWPEELQDATFEFELNCNITRLGRISQNIVEDP